MRGWWLLALAGCDGVFGLGKIQPLPVVDAPVDAFADCQSFHHLTVAPVPLDFGNVLRLSTDASYLHGAMYTVKGSTTFGIHLVRRDSVTDAWEIDTTRDTFDQSLMAGTMSPDGQSIYVASADGVDVVRYANEPGTSSWTIAEMVDHRPNEFVSAKGIGTIDGQTAVVETHASTSGGPYQLALRIAGPGGWTDSDVFAALSPTDYIQGGTLSADGLTVIYSVNDGPSYDYHLYRATRADTGSPFPPGVPLQLVVQGDFDQEPWLVAGGCSHLLFHRNMDLILEATP